MSSIKNIGTEKLDLLFDLMSDCSDKNINFTFKVNQQGTMTLESTMYGSYQSKDLYELTGFLFGILNVYKVHTVLHTPPECDDKATSSQSETR